MSSRSDYNYAKGFSTGQVHILQGLQQRLKEDPDIRTIVAMAEIINNMLEDKLKEREQIYAQAKKRS